MVSMTIRSATITKSLPTEPYHSMISPARLVPQNFTPKRFEKIPHDATAKRIPEIPTAIHSHPQLSTAIHLHADPPGFAVRFLWNILPSSRPIPAPWPTWHNPGPDPRATPTVTSGCKQGAKSNENINMTSADVRKKIVLSGTSWSSWSIHDSNLSLQRRIAWLYTSKSSLFPKLLSLHGS